MIEWVEKILKFFLADIWKPGHQDFWGTIMSTVVLGTITLFRKKIVRFLYELQGISNKYISIQKSLKRYRQSIDDETSSIIHSWKIEGQSLKELIVSPQIRRGNDQKRYSVQDYLKNEFRSKLSPRIIILGEAGSGKSVAMGYIVRNLFKINPNKFLLPILFSSTDIKMIRKETDLEQEVVDYLDRHQFFRKKKDLIKQEFVKKHLYEGHIILLIDGFDEPTKSTRIEFGKFLNKFLQKNKVIPFIISCRTSVWNKDQSIFSNLKFEAVQIASFTPYQIRQFVHQWEFSGRKSSDQLAELINSKAYLKNIAENPLMLTIITFLYSQPKRILPDNRVKFYAECIDALMEKWDNAKNIDRYNQFENTDKKAVLSHLAYEAIKETGITDEDISSDKLIQTVNHVLRELSRPLEKRDAIIKEIVQNSELLIELPPDAYKFPHRTFKEYFAAIFFYEQGKLEELLNLYKTDKGRWEETLSLFCGINVNQVNSDIVLTYLLNEFRNFEGVRSEDTFLFRALVESTRVTAKIADEILDQADLYLGETFNNHVIEQLGYLAVNHNWNHSEKAKKILIHNLTNKLSNHQFQKTLQVLVFLKDSEIEEIVLANLDKLDIRYLFIGMGNQVENYAIKLMEIVSTERYIEIFEGLLDSGRLELLFEFMIKSKNDRINQEAAIALAQMSTDKSFLIWLDEVNLQELPRNLNELIIERFNKYGWSKSLPKTQNGQLAYFLICSIAAKFIKTKEDQVFLTNNVKIHNWMKYIISAFMNLDGKQFSEWNLLHLPIKGTKKGIITYWKRNLPFSHSNILIFLYAIFIIATIIELTVDWNTFFPLIFVWSLLSFIFFWTITLALNRHGASESREYKTAAIVIALLIPYLLLVPEFNTLIIQRRIAYNPLFCIMVGSILCLLVYLLSANMLLTPAFSIINISIVMSMFIISSFSTFLNASGVVFQNGKVSGYLEDDHFS